MPETSRTRSTARRLLGAVALVAAGLVVVRLLMLAAAAPRDAMRAGQCRTNLTAIGLALREYHAAYGSFPPAYVADAQGRPLHGWRVLILPYLGEARLYERYRFDEPWDGPNNRKLLAEVPERYVCPNHPSHGLQPGGASYAAITGPGTVFPGAEPLAIGAIRDGPENTIAVGHVAGAGLPWTAPADFDVRTLRPALASPDRRGVHVLAANGEVFTLPSALTPAGLKALCTVDGGEPARIRP